MVRVRRKTEGTYKGVLGELSWRGSWTMVPTEASEAEEPFRRANEGRIESLAVGEAGRETVSVCSVLRSLYCDLNRLAVSIVLDVRCRPNSLTAGALVHSDGRTLSLVSRLGFSGDLSKITVAAAGGGATEVM